MKRSDAYGLFALILIVLGVFSATLLFISDNDWWMFPMVTCWVIALLLIPRINEMERRDE